MNNRSIVDSTWSESISCKVGQLHHAVHCGGQGHGYQEIRLDHGANRMLATAIPARRTDGDWE